MRRAPRQERVPRSQCSPPPSLPPRGEGAGGGGVPRPRRRMPDRTFLAWPFFADAHRDLAARLGEWAARELSAVPHGGDVDATCRDLVRRLAEGGWLRYAVPAAYGGVHERLDVRSLCLARETLARISGLADISFAMQGLGSGPITLFGSDALKERYLRRVGAGEAIAAFAISEAEAGSDIAAMQTTACLDRNNYIIDGEKTWISNGGIADFYVVFCRLESEKTPASRR